MLSVSLLFLGLDLANFHTFLNTCHLSISVLEKKLKTEMTAGIQENKSKHTRLKMNTF